MKLVRTLQSRKFWASVVGVLVSLGVVAWSDAQQAELVGGILAVISTVAYTLGVAVEDGMSAGASAVKQRQGQSGAEAGQKREALG